MTPPNDMSSIYIIKHPRDNQEVGQCVSNDPDLTVTFTYKGSKCEYRCLPVHWYATVEQPQKANLCVPTIVSRDEGDSDMRSVAYQDTCSKCSNSVESSTLKIK